MIRVLVVDDEPLVRSGVRMILESEDDIEVVGEAAGRERGNRASARTHAGRRHPRHPHARAGRNRDDAPAAPGTDAPRILILTTFDLDEYVYEAMKAGASGFILKNVPPAKLVDAVRTVADGDALLAPAITRRMIERFVQRAPAGPAADPTRRADRARAQRAAADRPRPLQRRDSHLPLPQRSDRQVARQSRALEARPARPHPGNGSRLRDRSGRARRRHPRLIKVCAHACPFMVRCAWPLGVGLDGYTVSKT